jgi:diguanylate cyclase (GGDEF)-like protein
MTTISHLRQPESLRHIGPAAALPLLQAIHRHLEPEALLAALWRHAAALTGATGLRFTHDRHELDIAIGGGQHPSSYTLSRRGEDLGELTLRFPRHPDEAVHGTVEDLLILAIPALRNALTHHTTCRRLAGLERDRDRAPARQAAPDGGWDDALILVSLDGFDDIRTAHGECWAQTLVQSIQNQIHEGLRDADGVFQVDEGLLAVLLPRTSEDAAIDVAGKIRVLISGLHLREGPITSQITACMGVVGARSARTPEDVLDQARAALSEARQEGASTIRAYRTGSSG